MQKIQTITSKGQITLPVAWRRKVGASHIVLETKGDRIEIVPARVSERQRGEYTVFDAIRDNKGKGLKAKDLVRILRRINA